MSVEDVIREALREQAERVQSVRDRWSDIEGSGAAHDGPNGRGPRRIVVVAAAFLVLAVSVVFVWSAFGPMRSRTPVGPAAPYRLPDGELVEPMTEREEAEVFSFRAVAASGLMDPHAARSFGFTYRDDTSRTDAGWRVGFAAMDCEPKGRLFTCRGLSGNHPEDGNALTDTYVTVALDGGVWTVTDFEGNVLEDEVARLVGYFLPRRAESSHWEFPAAGAWREEPGMVTGFATTALWVGPYPTEARGSVCDARALAADGADIGSVALWYQEPPDRSFERAGWMHARELADPPDSTTAVSITCHQYTGAGWKVASPPELVRQNGDVVGVDVALEWHGEVGITAPAECEVEAVNESNEVVWRRHGRGEQLWPQPPPERYPYRIHVFIPRPADNPPGAAHVGSYACRSL